MVTVVNDIHNGQTQNEQTTQNNASRESLDSPQSWYVNNPNSNRVPKDENTKNGEWRMSNEFLFDNNAEFQGQCRSPQQYHSLVRSSASSLSSLTANPNSGGGTSTNTKSTNNVGGAKTTSGSESLSSSVSTLPNLSNTGVILPVCVYFHSKLAVYLSVDDNASTTAYDLMQALINQNELQILNKPVLEQLFSLWMCSSFLEVQLRPDHKPFIIRKCWKSLLYRYSQGSPDKHDRDEPRIVFQRNIHFPRQVEEKIRDQKILEFLYEEAKSNVLRGRYPCEPHHCIMLGSIQARIEMGPYDPQVHTYHLFREKQKDLLPAHVRKNPNWTWLPISSKNSAEVKLLEQFKRIPSATTTKRLLKKYLEFCWSLPYYGSAFFHGQIEQPVRGLLSLFTYEDLPVLIAVNSVGLFVIDDVKTVLLLGLYYNEFRWEFALPANESDPNCLPCLFVQFMVLENGARVSKLLQIFSRQAVMMDTLITMFTNDVKSRDDKRGEARDQDTFQSSKVEWKSMNLTNKLGRLTMCTFDEENRLIGQMGSLTFAR